MWVRERVCVRVSLSDPTVVWTRNSLKNRGGAVQPYFARFHLCYAACCCCCVPVSHRKLLTPWLPRNSSSRTSKYSFCDSYERCFFVCVCVFCGRTILNTFKEEQFQPTLPLNFKSIREVRQRYNTSEPRNAHTYKGTPVFSLFNLRHYLKSSTCRRGTLYINTCADMLSLSSEQSRSQV